MPKTFSPPPSRGADAPGPQGNGPPRNRLPLDLLLARVAGGWLVWPWIRPGLSLQGGSGGLQPRVITVFVEDPQRVIAAVALWRQTPGAILVLQGQRPDQRVSRAYLQARGLWPDPDPRLFALTEGCDTVGQVTTLSLWMRRFGEPGSLTVVTSPAHLPRSLTIARIVLGAEGWRVQGVAAVTGDNRPEQPLRRWRDALRGQLWRLTGWNGNAELVCPGRARHLF